MSLTSKLHPECLQRFIRSVLESERHFLSKENLEFLDNLYVFSQSCQQVIHEGTIFFRARINEDLNDKPIPKDDMVPKPNLKSEGRVNPYNVNVLYLSNKPGVAVAEVRPGLFEPTTVASFKIKRDLRLVDFTTTTSGFDNVSAYENAKENIKRNPANSKNLNEQVSTWLEINKCFSTSFTSSEARLNYIPTQIISEFFKSKGYDGVIYQSQFDMLEDDEKSPNMNIALFDMSAAEAIETKLYHINQQRIGVTAITN